MANLALDDRRANNRHISTLVEYQTEPTLRLFPQPNEKLPRLGPRTIRNIKRADMKAHFNALRNSGCTVSQVNKSIASSFTVGSRSALAIPGHAYLPHPARLHSGVVPGCANRKLDTWILRTASVLVGCR